MYGWRELDFGKGVTQVDIQISKGLRPPSLDGFPYRIVGDRELREGPQWFNYEPAPDIGKAGSSAKDTDKQGQAQVWKRQLAWFSTLPFLVFGFGREENPNVLF